MGDMAEHLDSNYDYSAELDAADLDRRDEEWRKMGDRFRQNTRAEVGATIGCACCGRLVVKKTYQQKFCPPVVKGKRKSYACKDRYNNIMNPRGKFAHLQDLD